ncbi:type IV toxin-antitoxin system AbiEi family antitoxin domain-containing protein [Deinococcus aestuarii]|uniref:type IV toxin-antitoxin system AbiEi family antitoxin domain-containing protein n=1 Tax=Deinococcus aestuarii TaxID=2774531 RepID=UPI001C0DFAF5|nr:type IV toxin-antitoxin system AbiEi family antitoxin domain-containing protein [Deinococcus aestuarii]
MTALTPSSLKQLRVLFEARGGYLTAREVRVRTLANPARTRRWKYPASRPPAGLPQRMHREHGFHTEQLSRLVALGDIERVQRGVYRLLDDQVPFGAAEELLEVQLRVPFARPCLVSALHLHGLTTTRPARLQFAIPRNRTFPEMEGLPTEVFYFGERAYTTGTLDLPVAGRSLTTYTPEKTLADLLKYAPRFGRDLIPRGAQELSAPPQSGHPCAP